MKRGLPPDWKTSVPATKIVLAILSIFLALPAFAQNRTVFAGAANAIDFAYGTLPGSPAPLQVDLAGGPSATGVATLTVSFGTTTLGDGTIITPLSTRAPITVGTGANQETVTPSAVSCSTPQVYQSCSFTATFSNQHGTGDRVASASYGIQEAALYVSGKQGGGLVIVSAQLLKQAGITFTNAAVLTFLSGFNSVSANVTLLNYMGVSGALSYKNSTPGSAYAATAVVLY